MSKTKVRVAIVGTGSIAAVHAQALLSEEERAEIVAVVDVRPEAASAFAERHKVPTTYSDVASMLETERPQLVNICTPPNLHASLSIQCLEAGAWVLCEKPLAGSLRDVDRILDAEARSGAYCSSVYQWRFGSGAKHLASLIGEGALGRPLVGVCQTTWYRDAAYYAVPWRGTWAGELGGCSMGHGIHAMDLFLSLFGPWSQVSAMTGTLDHPIEVEDVSLATVRFENGALGSIINSVVSPRQESRLRFDFQRVTVELRHLYDYQNADWSYALPPGRSADAELERWTTLPPSAPTLHHAQVSHVLDRMASGERPDTSGEGARATLEFIASLYKSAATGQTVTRGSVLAGDPFYEAMGGPSGGPA